MSDDAIIYRFRPHGSKKLRDLKESDSRYQDLTWNDYRCRVPVICHDQEPLDFDLYDRSQQSWQEIKQWFLESYHDHSYINILKLAKPEFWQSLRCQNIGLLLESSSINDRFVLLHSERNSLDLQKYANQAVGAYWWSHALISKDWYRYAQHDAALELTQDHTYDYDFNVYARAWTGSREYRLSLLQMIVDSSLLPACRVSFDSRDSGQHYQNYVFTNPDLPAVTDLTKLLVTSVPSMFSATYNSDHYRACAIDVVTETLFDDQRNHLTEKVLRPIACGKPFILAGTCGSLAYLRDYGFQTFNDVLDESYDSISDPAQRLEAILGTMKQWHQMTSAHKQKALWHMRRITMHNQQHFFSAEFSSRITQELRSNLSAAIKQIKDHHQHGRKYLAQQRLLTGQQKHLLERINGDSSYREQRLGLLRHIRSCRSAAVYDT